MRLTVVHAFSLDVHGTFIEYVRGCQIDDPDLIELVLKSENAGCVVKTMNGHQH